MTTWALQDHNALEDSQQRVSVVHDGECIDTYNPKKFHDCFRAHSLIDLAGRSINNWRYEDEALCLQSSERHRAVGTGGIKVTDVFWSSSKAVPNKQKLGIIESELLVEEQDSLPPQFNTST
jgi:hypothetical protein